MLAEQRLLGIYVLVMASTLVCPKLGQVQNTMIPTGLGVSAPFHVLPSGPREHGISTREVVLRSRGEAWMDPSRTVRCEGMTTRSRFRRAPGREGAAVAVMHAYPWRGDVVLCDVPNVCPPPPRRPRKALMGLCQGGVFTFGAHLTGPTHTACSHRWQPDSTAVDTLPGLTL